MAKLIDKLWNWGHLEGSHNDCTGLNCSMTPEQFKDVYGIKNAFIVSYGGNIQPPFDNLAKRFSVLNKVKWSVLGDNSSPLPDDRLGNTNDVIDACKVADNITGGIVDDFFSPVRMERFTPAVLSEIKQKLNDNGKDFWCVLYHNQLDLDLSAYLPCFDGVTFWLWGHDNIDDLDIILPKLKSVVKDKPLMLGIYLYNYLDEGAGFMDPVRFEKQIKLYFEMLLDGQIEGVVFCSSTIGDADTEANKLLKKYIAEYGDKEIKK